MYTVRGFGAVTQASVAPLIGQQVTVTATDGRTFGPASFTSFGTNAKGITAMFRDAIGNVREYNLSDISSVVQIPRTVVVEQPVVVEPYADYGYPAFYGGGWGGGRHGGGHRHHHHHGIEGFGQTALSSSTGSMLAAAISVTVIVLGVLGAAWLLTR